MTIYPTKKPCPCLGCKDREETKRKLKKQEKAEADIASHTIENLGKIAKRNRRSWQR